MKFRRWICTVIAIFAVARQLSADTVEPPALIAADKPVIVQVENKPLEEVLAGAAKQAGVSLKVDYDALKGITKSTPVTLHLTGVPLSRVIDLAIGQNSTDNQFWWDVVPGGLIVTTQANLKKQTITRSYDISDIVVPIQIMDVIDVRSPVSTAYFSQIELWEALYGGVTPFAWEARGGELGTLKDSDGANNNRLMKVTATLRMHRDIERFLADIRGTIKKREARKPISIEEKMQQNLKRRMTAQWKNVPLKDVFADIARAADLNLYVDWTANVASMSQVYESDTPVTLDKGKIPASSALSAVLDSLPAMAGSRRIVSTDGYGTVIITTPSSPPWMVPRTPRIYDVQSLLADGKDSTVTDFVKMIETEVYPREWVVHGGTVASLSMLNNRLLVVLGVPYTHEAVAETLKNYKLPTKPQNLK